MLPFNWHRRFAKKRASDSRERRLLAFINTPGEDDLSSQYFADGGLETDGRMKGRESIIGNDAVEGGRGETRNAVESVISNPEDHESDESKEPIEVEEMAQRIKKSQEKIRKMLRQQSGIRELINIRITDKKDRNHHLTELDKTIRVAELAQNDLNVYERMATSMIHFKIGAITPQTFEREYLSTVNSNEDHIEGFDANSIAADLAVIDLISLTSQERRERRSTVINPIMESEPMQDVLNFMHSAITEIETSMKDVDRYVSELEESEEFDHQPKMTWTSFWANSMSVNDLIAAGKKFYEGMLKSKEEWDALKVARLAEGIGNTLAWLPLGEQTKQVLKRQTESAHDAVRDEHKKGLELSKPSFSEIIDLLDDAKDSNPNHFRAILEYAADHAWLYDYDAIHGTVFGMNIKQALSGIWSKENIGEYLRELDNKNGSGESSEKQRGYDRVSTIDSIPPLMRVLHDELDQGNFWATQGILKRGMEKGKEGETSTWISVTIFRYIRDNPNARKYFPKNLLDDLGNIGIVHPAWTSTFFKTDRNEIEAFQKSGSEDVSEAGELGSVIDKVEDHILEKVGQLPTDKKELDRIVAKILATHTVEYRGHTFSIFDDRYRHYRKFLGDVQTSIDPRAADDDFFSADNNGSEMILLGTEAFRGILALQSTGEFNEAVKAQYFLGQLIFRAKDLKKNFGENHPALRNYITATQKRMNNWLLTNANDDRSAVKLANTSFPNGMPIMLGLFKQNIITIDTILRLGIKDKNGSLAPLIVRQILKDREGPSMSAAEIMQTAERLHGNGLMTDTAHKIIAEVVKDTTGYVRPANNNSQQNSSQTGGVNMAV